jgi:prepilin-type processing-associated H-X9-DG protein
MMALTPYLGYTNSSSVQTNTIAMLRGVGWCPAEPKRLIQPNASTINFSYGWNASIAGPVPGEQPRAAYFQTLSKMFLIGDQKVSANYRIAPVLWNDSPTNSLFSDRHGGICNVAFVDGHVESRALTNLPYRNGTHSSPAAEKAAFSAFWNGL